MKRENIINGMVVNGFIEVQKAQIIYNTGKTPVDRIKEKSCLIVLKKDNLHKGVI